MALCLHPERLKQISRLLADGSVQANFKSLQLDCGFRNLAWKEMMEHPMGIIPLSMVFDGNISIAGQK